MKTIRLRKAWTYRTPVVTIDFVVGDHEVEDTIADTHRKEKAMGIALQKLARRAILTRLKGHAPLTEEVATTSINPIGKPVWPFIALRSPRTTRLKAAGLNGGEIAVDLHAFARGVYDEAGALTETAEDHAGRIGGLIEAALADARFEFEGATVRLALSDMRLLQDGEDDAYHYFAQVNVRVLIG